MYMTVKAHLDHVTYEQIESMRIPASFSNFRIFFIADIHRRKINPQTLDAITVPIDLVLIGGDLMERYVPFERVRDNIRELKRWQKPLYFVWGNNDYEVNTLRLLQILREEQVIVLEDQCVQFIKGNDTLNLIGLNYYRDESLQPIMDWTVVSQDYTIVLLHDPQFYHLLGDTEKDKVDLVLAGHTHGGQIRLFGFGFYERGGLSTERGKQIFVTEGYGYTLLPFRLQTRASCHVITLIRK